MADLDDTVFQAMAEANDLFSKMAEAVQGRVNRGIERLDVVEIANEVGLDINPEVIKELQIPPFVPYLRILPLHCWFPFLPLYCWWWGIRYPSYECYCPYWCHQCRWVPL
jgi:hypothetical protein